MKQERIRRLPSRPARHLPAPAGLPSVRRPQADGRPVVDGAEEILERIEEALGDAD